jgi:hypothetical protein
MAIAKAAAADFDCPAVAILDQRRPGTFKAYVAGCFTALRMKGWKIQPISLDFSQYDRVVLYSPVWAGHPAPAINAFLAQLPKGMSVEMNMVSASGESAAREKLEARLRELGCILEKYTDIKA